MTASVIQATKRRFRLAEGPVWDARQELVHWADILDGSIHSGRILENDTIAMTSTARLDGLVAAFALSEGGDWIIATQHDLVAIVGPDRVETTVQVLDRTRARRLNDGKPDPQGRFVVGSLNSSGRSNTEVLIRLDDDWSLQLLDDRLALSNGLAWSGDGTLLYTVDSVRQVIEVRDYDSSGGRVGQRREIVRVEGGLPDGLCLDEEGLLWVAVWGAGEVRRYSLDGTLVQTIAVPAPNTSSLAFAGPNLDLLVITTAFNEMGAAGRARWPSSGALFTVRPGVRGQSQSLWNGVIARDLSGRSL